VVFGAEEKKLIKGATESSFAVEAAAQLSPPPATLNKWRAYDIMSMMPTSAYLLSRINDSS
jgi:hypothetical protein